MAPKLTALPGYSMLPEPFRYPLEDDDGRSTLLETTASIVLVALGIRYGAELTPSPIALAPIVGLGIGLVFFLAALSHTLVGAEANEAARPRSVRSRIRTGVVTTTLTVAFLAVPTALVVTTVSGFAGVSASSVSGGEIVLLVQSTVVLFVFGACAYVLPVIVAVAVRTGRVRSVTDTDAVFPALRDTAYFFRWIGAALLGICALELLTVTILSSDVRGLAAAVAAAYLVLVSGRIVGVGYARATVAANAGRTRS